MYFLWLFSFFNKWNLIFFHVFSNWIYVKDDGKCFRHIEDGVPLP